jgi:DNA-binding MarR family transcriptional regulator
MADDTTLLREIRDLLRVIAEPAIAKRDERFRELLLKIVGKSKGKAKAVLLMDGSRTPIAIRSESGVDQGDLSRCIKALRQADLVTVDEDNNLKLSFYIPANFFEKNGGKSSE